MGSWIVFFQLIKRDLSVFKRDFWQRFSDTALLFITNVLVFGYFLQQEGAPKGFAAFFVVGAVASFGFTQIVGKVGIQLADMGGDRTIFHTLIMPIRSNMVFYYIGLSWAITSILMSILLFPLGKLIVLSEWSLDQISWWRLPIVFVSANLFFGYFALWLTGILNNMTDLNRLWFRYIAPMWLFGGYIYSWQSAYNMSPIVGYISLINPMIYVMEGMRAAALGQAGYLPFWLSIVMLWVFIVLCALHAKQKLKRKLDCI